MAYGFRDPETGCLLWRGPRTSGGYGTVRVKGKTQYVHIVAFTLSGGVIPAGHVLDHVCKKPNRLCFDPTHLEPVTQRVNVLRGRGVAAQHARKTHCKNGHPLAGENLIIINAERGWRDCRQCRKDKRARAKARRSR